MKSLGHAPTLVVYNELTIKHIKFLRRKIKFTVVQMEIDKSVEGKKL